MSFGRRSRSISRAGFTLVELLVVISIIGMLMALLFPAINSARETGRQNTCRNNIRSIGQGLAQHENAKNVFPQIHTVRNGVSLPLLHELFPYMDRMDLYRNREGVGYPTNNSDYPEPYIEYMQCPSNPKGDLGMTNNFVFNVGTRQANSANPTHTGDGSAASPRGITSQFLKTDVPEKYAALFFEFGSISTAELTAGDGTTNTLMISENLDAADWNTTVENRIGFTWSLDNSGNPVPADALINQRKGEATFASDPESDNGLWAPTSNHPAVVNVGFADGHVRTLSDATSYRVYVQLCTPRGEAFGLGPLTSSY
jgi:prepilin-type N-terminal cleavage/methylation domain-containing protein/prepilin-type processing-associated H-X9-DG protein